MTELIIRSFVGYLELTNRYLSLCLLRHRRLNASVDEFVAFSPWDFAIVVYYLYQS